MELLRALKAQQLRRTGDPNKGGSGRSSSSSSSSGGGESSGGSPLRQQASE